MSVIICNDTQHKITYVIRADTVRFIEIGAPFDVTKRRCYITFDGQTAITVVLEGDEYKRLIGDFVEASKK